MNLSDPDRDTIAFFRERIDAFERRFGTTISVTAARAFLDRLEREDGVPPVFACSACDWRGSREEILGYPHRPTCPRCRWPGICEVPRPDVPAGGSS